MHFLNTITNKMSLKSQKPQKRFPKHLHKTPINSKATFQYFDEAMSSPELKILQNCQIDCEANVAVFQTESSLNFPRKQNGRDRTVTA